MTELRGWTSAIIFGAISSAPASHSPVPNLAVPNEELRTWAQKPDQVMAVV